MDLPRAIIPTENLDKKGWTETWKDKAKFYRKDEEIDIINFPTSYRCLLVGPVSCGKTLIISHLVNHQYPVFEKMYLLHCSEFTKEYDQFVGVKKLKTMPTIKEWETDDMQLKKQKAVLVIDDYEFSNLDRKEKAAFSRSFKYCSSHMNVTILCSSQTFHSVPCDIRKLFSVFIMWKGVDLLDFKRITSKIGLDYKKHMEPLMELAYEGPNKNMYDSLWIDRTSRSPWPYRKNGYQILRI